MQLQTQLSPTHIQASSGSPNGSPPPGGPSRRKIDAAELACEIRVKTSRLLCYKNLEVVGPLNLKYAIVSRPLEFTNCTFTGGIDLRYAECKQPVSFLACTFAKEFNSGDKTESLTIYRKDLICNHSHFDGQASFNGAQVEGSALFNKVEFCSTAADPESYDVDFTGFSCVGGLECVGAGFCGRTSFNGAHVGGNALFIDAKFQFVAVNAHTEDVNFTGFMCKKMFECVRTSFQGNVSFNAIECRDALFSGVQFLYEQSDANFRGAILAGNLQFDPAPVGLTSQPARFRGGLDCLGIRCGRKLLMQGAQFEGTRMVRFTRADFGWHLNCDGVLFSGPVSFNGARCDGDSTFRKTRFIHTGAFNKDTKDDSLNDNADFRFFRAGGNLDFSEVLCRGVMNMGQAGIAGKLRLEGATFEAAVHLYDMTIKIIELRSYHPHTTWYAFPFQPKSLDLTSCTFERFHGGREGQEGRLAREFVQRQNPHMFSRDPYIQLQKYYQNNGQEHAARDIHLAGHKAIHQNALKGDCIKWSRSQKIKDGALMYLTGWGLRTERLLLAALACILFGMLMIWTPGSLQASPKAQPGSPASAVQATSQPAAGATGVGAGTTTSQLVAVAEPSAFQRFAYNIDLFVPALSLGYTEAWQPVGTWRMIYGFIHAIMGWILLSLYLASLSGLINGD